MHMDKRTVLDGMDRFKATGSILPGKPGVKEGSVFQNRRKTSKMNEKKMETLILEHRGDEGDYTIRSLQDDCGFGLAELHRTSANRRVNEWGFTAHPPPHKEQYGGEEMACRKDWGEWGQKKTEEDDGYWHKVIYIDEHLTIWPNPVTGSRQIACKKQNVWRREEAGENATAKWEKDNRFDVELVAPKDGKNTKGGTGIYLQAAIMDDEVLTIEPTTTYVQKTVPVDKSKPRLSKNGKRLGRPPKPKVQKDITKRGYDEAAHAYFIEELHGRARISVKNRSGQEVASFVLFQDWLSLHRSPKVKAVMKKLRYTDAGPPACGYSPDTNPIERVFAELERRLLLWQRKQRAGTKEEWVARVRAVCAEMSADGHIHKTIGSQPKICDLLVKAKGGPTRY